MAERFNTLYSLADNLYIDDFPFVISAGKLLFDNQTGKALAQLKIKNIGKNTASALKIRIKCYDVAKHELGSSDFTYLDLDCTTNCEFGQKTAVYLPHSETRSYTVNFVEAVFSDGSVITAPEGELSAVPSCESVLSLGKEHAAEFKLIHGRECDYIPQKYKSFWVCSCGNVVGNEFNICHNCSNGIDALITDAKADVLIQKRNERLEKEEEQRRKNEEEHKEHIYNKACKGHDPEESMTLFKSILGYKDSEALYEKYKAEFEKKKKRNKKIAIIVTSTICVVIAFCILWTNVIDPAMKYGNAVKLMEAGQYEEAISGFESLVEYKDSADKILECKYLIALSLMENGQYEEAISEFELLVEYKDSLDKISECKTAILDIKYNEAVNLMESGQYEEAVAKFELLTEYKDSADKTLECKYLTALSLMESGKYDQAHEVFDALGEYRESVDKKAEIRAIQLKKAKLGMYIKFGTYEQDDNASNGKEEIEWRVLDKQDNKVLVISKYALDRKPYNETSTTVTWETCTLRKWLNNDFINAAFSANEKAMIPTVTVVVDKKADYAKAIGNATQDQIFLLSITEFKEYFSYGQKCELTTYAKSGNIWDSGAYCQWWLRSPGVYSNYAAYIDKNGSIDGDGDYYKFTRYNCGNDVEDTLGVRPALWIDLNA